MIEFRDYGHTIVLYFELQCIARGSESEWNQLMQNLDSELSIHFGKNLGLAYHRKLEAFYIFDPFATNPITLSLRPQEVRVFQEFQDKGIRELLKQGKQH